MINIKPKIAAALADDQNLIALLGVDKIYRAAPPETIEMPVIVYGELDNQPLVMGDERELVSEIMIQVDVWHESSTTEISQAVDRIMTGMGGERQRAPDDDDNQPKQCRILVYRFVVDENGEVL